MVILYMQASPSLLLVRKRGPMTANATARSLPGPLRGTQGRASVLRETRVATKGARGRAVLVRPFALSGRLISRTGGLSLAQASTGARLSLVVGK